MLALPEALKLERDTNGYAYLNPGASRVDGMDDTANFKALQVSTWDGPLGHALSPGSGFEKGGVRLAPQFNFGLLLSLQECNDCDWVLQGGDSAGARGGGPGVEAGECGTGRRVPGQWGTSKWHP